MQTLEQVQTVLDGLKATGTPPPEIIRQLAPLCLGWPYVFGAWGEECRPAARRRRVRDDHPTIRTACPAIMRGDNSCDGCKWGAGVRMYDCRGFTRWLIQQAGSDIAGSGATSQWDNTANWVQRGEIDQMPADLVSVVFRRVDGRMEHTGMHLGGGRVIHCSRNVEEGTTARGWTHYAIPKGIYRPEEIPVTHRTLRRGAQGDDVRAMQLALVGHGYTPGECDGIFGKRTEAAVKAFQKAQGLSADGICGPKTWAALTEPAQTYTVRIEGATWAQYKRILEICPLAEADPEPEGG